jgi:hypothetical protein
MTPLASPVTSPFVFEISSQSIAYQFEHRKELEICMQVGFLCPRCLLMMMVLIIDV